MTAYDHAVLAIAAWPFALLSGALTVVPGSGVHAEVAVSSEASGVEEPEEPEAGFFGDLDTPSPPPPDVATEPVPVPPPVSRRRSGRGALATGGTLLGLGVLGRIAVESFWVGPAQLRASEPFGTWSIPGIALATGFPNAMVLPGLVALGVGARHRGRWWISSGYRRRDLARVRRNRRLGWGLLGGGLSLWAVTRAAAVPVLRACETNGCAHGYIESTYWLSLGAVVPGAVLAGLAGGERRALRSLSVTPWVGPGAQGLAVGGRL